MKLEHETIDLATRHPFHTARFRASAARQSVVVTLTDGEGRQGWGEAPATAYYGETAGTVAAILDRLAPVLTEAAAGEPFALERIERSLAKSIGENPAARVAISSALHDLVGKALGVPIWKLWGLDAATAPVSSFTIGLDELAVMRDKAQEAAAYPLLKIKVGTDRDEDNLRAIRDARPDARLIVDANTGWTVKQALARMPMLVDHGVELVEQPLVPGNIEGLRELRASSPLPLIADESCRTVADISRLVGAVDGINIKLAKCGSLREALRMVHVARAHHMMVMLGCMIESTLGIAAAIQLAPLVDVADLDGAALLANDPFEGPGLRSDGTLRFNEEPGLGVRRRGDAS